MNKQDVIDFFDRLAPGWDDGMIRNEAVIAEILDRGGIRAGIDVLDVACGTGVLIPDYIHRRTASLTAVDISPEMVRIARSKFPQVDIICGDILDIGFEKRFDAAMVYNAFPHFGDPAALISKLASVLKSGGRLTIAHGMSRSKLRQHHSGTAAKISIELLHEDDLAALMTPLFQVDVKISDDEKYILSGTLR